tara:strand:+ start:406 stop:1875 length:1470 start_codon:yes stop_codon:yes gene_type:complete
MPRLGIGMPLVSTATEAPVLAVQDFFWLNDISGELTPIHTASRTNLIPYSEDFSQWSVSQVAVTPNAIISPDGTLNASKLTPSTSSSVHLLSTAGTATMTISIYAKAGGYHRFRFNTGSSGNGYAAFDLNTGAVRVAGGTYYTSSSIESVGNDWYRCTLTLTNGVASNTTVAIEDNDGNVSFEGNGTNAIYMWGGQSEQDSRASAYIPTSGSAVTVATPLNDTHNAWDYDHTNLTLEEDPDSEGSWERPSNVVLNHDFADLGAELVDNKDFATDSDWSKGTGWTISGGTANCDGTQSGNTDLSQNITTDTGEQYKITYTVSNYSAGSIFIRLNSGNVTSTKSSNGTFTEVLSGASGTQFILRANLDFNGSIDNVSIKQVDPNDRWIVPVGWSIESGKAVSSSGNASLTQDVSATAGVSFEVNVNITDYTSGTLYVDIGGSPAQTATSAGNKTFHFTTSSTGLLRFYGGAFRGSIDNITVKEYAAMPLDV